MREVEPFCLLSLCPFALRMASVWKHHGHRHEFARVGCVACFWFSVRSACTWACSSHYYRPTGGRRGKGEREEQSNKFFFFFWGPVRFKWAEIAIYDRHVCVAAAVIDSTRRKKKILLKLHSFCLFIYIRWVVFFERKRENGAKGWPVNWPLSPI